MVNVANGLRRARGAVLSTAAAAALLVPAVVTAAQTPEATRTTAAPATAAAAPQDTVLFVSIDLNRDSEQWRQADELMARIGLPGGLDAAGDELMSHPKNTSGQFTQEDLDALTGGEMAVVVTSEAVRNVATLIEAGAEAAAAYEESGAMAGTPAAYGEATPAAMPDLPKLEGYGVVGVLEPGDMARAWAYVERQMAQQADDSGGQLEEVEYNGATILVAPKTIPYSDDHSRDRDKDTDKQGMGREATPAAGMNAADDDDGWDDNGHDGGSWGDDDGAWDDHDMDAEMARIVEQLSTGTIAAARAGDFIVAGGSASDLEPFIDAVNGDQPSLAELPAMQDVRAEFPNDALAFFYASAPAVRDALDQEWVDRIDEINQTFYPGADTSALWDVSSGGVIWADRPGLRFDEVSLVAGGGALPDGFYPANRAIDFSGQVPSSTLVYFAGGVTRTQLEALAMSAAQSINQAMNGEEAQPQSLADVEEMLTPEFYERQLAEAEQVLGFNLKTDLVDHLTGDFGFAFGMPQFAMGNFTVDAILAAGVADKTPLQDTVERIARLIERADSEIQIDVEQRDGDTLYRIGDADDAQAPAALLGVLGDQLVIGSESGVANLEQAPAETLADDPQFQTVMGLLPPDRYAETYVNLGPIVDFFVMLSGEGGFTGVGPDADPACAGFADQAAAQRAFEEEPMANSNLDGDFDGMACEDFFSPMAATPTAPTGSPEAIRAFAMAAWADEGKAGSNSILYIVGPGA